MSSQAAQPPPRGNVQKRVAELRQRLLALQYDEPFSPDSLALVSRLFLDLLATTESYEHLQHREEATAQDLALSQAQLFPLKKDNARLVRENNSLHQRLIKAAEDAGAAERRALLEARRLEQELAELRDSTTQKDLRLQETMSRCDALQSALQRALHSSADSSPEQQQQHTSNSRYAAVRAAAAAAQEGSSSDDESSHRRAASAASAAAALDAAAQRVEQLQSELREARSRCDALEADRASLEAGATAREREVQRMGKLLEAGCGHEQSSLRHAAAANQKIVEQLNGQVDFLNNQLAVREAQVSLNQSSSSKSDSQAHVDGICRAL
jgi:centrosomal protein CEP135